MKKHFGLLTNIADKYSIERGKHEDELSYKSRIIYSFLGQAGYSSLMDIQDEDLIHDKDSGLSTVSVVHFKDRIKTLLNSIHDIYCREIKISDIVIEEIYNVMVNAGYIYHANKRLSAPLYRTATASNCIYIRGQSLSKKVSLSGLGCFMPGTSEENFISLSEMFRLQECTLAEFWEQLTKNTHWSRYDNHIALEYLRTRPPFNKGYWNDKPDSKNIISLARTAESNTKSLYYLYRFEGGNIFISQLPVWITGSNYRSVSSACLAANGTLPPVKYHVDGNIVYLALGYLLPPDRKSVV